ncbi:hypothetical protein [Brevibacillus centrosporus]|uniref:hypothetical protein n=2 Tax=Brevibacillus centrosporus TaxID=54910 RepID=UPI003B01DA24
MKKEGEAAMHDKGLYVLYLVGIQVLLFILYPLLEFKIKNDGLTFAVLLIASHFIAKTLSSPAGVWSDHSKKSAVKKKDFEQ